MDKPYGYDETQALGEYKALPAGGYVCRIMAVEETKSQSGNDMLKISLDIAEGEFRNRFADMYRSNTRPDKKRGCVAYQLVYDTSGGTNRGFKSFCTAAEESNPGFTIQWGPAFGKCFQNRLIGVIFGREEYIGNDGKAHWSTKPKFFRSAEKIRKGDFEVPEDKYLPNSQPAANYSGYPAAAQTADPFAVPPQPVPAAQQHTAPAPGLEDFTEIIPDGDLPF